MNIANDLWAAIGSLAEDEAAQVLARLAELKTRIQTVQQRANLMYMRAVAEAWPEEAMVQQAAGPLYQVTALCWYMGFHLAVYTNNIPTNFAGHPWTTKNPLPLSGAGLMDVI